MSLILISLEGMVTEYVLHFEFPTINNEAEYEVSIINLRITQELGMDHLYVNSDS